MREKGILNPPSQSVGVTLLFKTLGFVGSALPSDSWSAGWLPAQTGGVFTLLEPARILHEQSEGESGQLSDRKAVLLRLAKSDA